MSWLAIVLGFMIGFFAAALLSSSKIEDLERKLEEKHYESLGL